MPAQLLFCLLCLSGRTVDELISAHEATMAKIEAVAVECDYYWLNSGAVPEHTYYLSVARDATRNRTRFEVPNRPNGKVSGLVCADLLDDGRYVRLLQNWDQLAGQEVVGSDWLRAEILITGLRGQPGHPWIYDPLMLLLQRVQLPGGSESFHVGDYLRKGGKVQVLPAVHEIGRQLIPVSLNHPQFGNKTPGVGITSTLYFAPECGGLILKQAHDVPAGSGFATPVRVESTVAGIQPLPGGIILPRSVRHIFIDKTTGKVYFDHVVKVSTLQINDEVPESAFDFHFPEGIVVTDRTQPGGVLKHRWGPGDAPAETWVDQPPPWAIGLAMVYWGLDTRVVSLLGILLAVLSGSAWYLLRRQRRRLQALAAS
jgi:hypothetical protein